MKTIIVGGGAGGLELATYLGKKLKKTDHEVLLIDRTPTHVWKPLLHEVAAGSLDAEIDSVSYRAHAHRYGFKFKLGNLSGIDRENKTIHLSAVTDDDGYQILPERDEPYDYLVVAIGSVCNDFNTPGATEHCRFLDSTQQAVNFHSNLVNRFIHLNRKLIDEPNANLNIAVVGGGATGVELSAELYNSRDLFTVYGLDRLKNANLNITVIEAGPRLVGALSEKVSDDVHKALAKIGTKIRINTLISEVQSDGFITSEGEKINADLLIWAAGVKVPEFLASIDGLENNRINQLIVNSHLQTTNDEYIYAIGDCAGYQIDEKKWVPPRAQSAHQMAKVAGKNILRSINGKPLVEFKYVDMGSLISLSRFSTTGVLMGNLVRGDTINVRGKLARVAYISLYRMHQVALHGWVRATLFMLSDKINHILRPRLKLH